MYTKAKKIIIDKENIGNYIEGFDVYNSLLLHKLQDQSIRRELYQIKYDYRPDLVAIDYYGSDSYMALVIIQSKISQVENIRGNYIQLIPKDILDSIINGI